MRIKALSIHYNSSCKRKQNFVFNLRWSIWKYTFLKRFYFIVVYFDNYSKNVSFSITNRMIYRFRSKILSYSPEIRFDVSCLPKNSFFYASVATKNDRLTVVCQHYKIFKFDILFGVLTKSENPNFILLYHLESI